MDKISFILCYFVVGRSYLWEKKSKQFFIKRERKKEDNIYSEKTTTKKEKNHRDFTLYTFKKDIQSLFFC